MAEAFVGTFKAELVARRRFASLEVAEHEALSWIGFCNAKGLHEELGDIQPDEFEAGATATSGSTSTSCSPPRGTPEPSVARLRQREVRAGGLNRGHPLGGPGRSGRAYRGRTSSPVTFSNGWPIRVALIMSTTVAK